MNCTLFVYLQNTGNFFLRQNIDTHSQIGMQFRPITQFIFLLHFSLQFSSIKLLIFIEIEKISQNIGEHEMNPETRALIWSSFL